MMISFRNKLGIILKFKTFVTSTSCWGGGSSKLLYTTFFILLNILSVFIIYYFLCFVNTLKKPFRGFSIVIYRQRKFVFFHSVHTYPIGLEMHVKGWRHSVNFFIFHSHCRTYCETFCE